MILEAFVSLLYNAALLLSLVVVVDILSTHSYHEKIPEQLLAGFILGAISLGIMMNPLILKPGVVFDTRTIFLSIGTMFFGLIPSAVAIIMSSAYRLWMGGAGVVTGCSTIFAAALWGYLFRLLHHKWKNPNGFAEFYTLGILNHLTMLVLMLLIPGALKWEVLRIITLPVLLIYPFGTVLLGQLATRRMRRLEEQRKLELSEEKYRLLTETSNDLIIIRNLDETIGFANRKAQEFLGLKATDLNKVPASRFVHKDYLDILKTQAQHRLEGELESRLFNLEVLDKDGASHLMEVSSTPMLDAGKLTGILAVMRDITDRVQTETQRNRYASRLQILRELDGIVLETISFEDTCSTAVRKLQQLIPFDFMSVNVLRGDEIELVELLKEEGQYPYLQKGNRHQPDRDFVSELLQQKSMVLNKVECNPPAMPVRAKLCQDGFRSFMYNAMTLDDRILGFLWFGSLKQDFFDDEYLEIGQEFANQLAIVLNHISLIQTIKDHAEDLSRTVDERTAQLQNALEELEAFSYTVAHDLRSPLKLIYGYSDALAEDYAPKLDSDGQAMLDSIKATVKRMDKLITELLDLAKLNPDAVKAEALNMQEMAERIWSILNPGTVKLKMNPLPLAWGDPTLISQVWQNLLENAIKFTGHCVVREVEIGCKSTKTEHTFYVKDSGVGFDPQKAESIFVPLKRLHSIQDFEGTGIGLATCKKIILNHRGRIWAESEPGHGSSFYFSLPVVENHDQ